MTTTVASNEPRIAELEQHVQALHLRLRVMRLVVASMGNFVEDDEDSQNLVIDDVITRWHARTPQHPQEPSEFWHWYCARVEHLPPSGETQPWQHDGFDPADPHDEHDDSFRQVWAAYVELCARALRQRWCCDRRAAGRPNR